MGPFLRPFTTNKALSGPGPPHTAIGPFFAVPPPVGGFGVVCAGVHMQHLLMGHRAHIAYSTTSVMYGQCDAT